MKAARGRGEYLNFLAGKPLTRGQAIKAKCYECMGGFEDGKIDCLGKSCPLYGLRAYKGRLQDTESGSEIERSPEDA